jgi:hypothetical protein
MAVTSSKERMLTALSTVHSGQAVNNTGVDEIALPAGRREHRESWTDRIC